MARNTGSEVVVLRIGGCAYHSTLQSLRSHPESVLGRIFSDPRGVAERESLRNSAGEYALDAACADLAGLAPALIASVVAAHATGTLLPVDGVPAADLRRVADRLGCVWAALPHDLVADPRSSRADVARGVALFRSNSSSSSSADSLRYAALGLHVLGRNREAATVLARLPPDDAAGLVLRAVVERARRRSRRVGVAVAAVAAAAAAVGCGSLWLAARKGLFSSFFSSKRP